MGISSILSFPLYEGIFVSSDFGISDKLVCIAIDAVSFVSTTLGIIADCCCSDVVTLSVFAGARN